MRVISGIAELVENYFSQGYILSRREGYLAVLDVVAFSGSLR